MIGSLRLEDVSRYVHGKLVNEDLGIVCSHVSTDSRHIVGGELFVPLQGKHYDGHNFIVQAAKKGAVATLTSRDTSSILPAVQVDNTLNALGDLGKLARERFNGLVVAITGSVGKTTCKEMIAHILRLKGKTLATKNNNNNEVGVPLALLQLEEEHKFAVIEMGAAKPGDIKYLTQMVIPDVGYITNAKPAHLDKLGTWEGVAREKGELYKHMKADGKSVFNLDDRYSDYWLQCSSTRDIYTYSLENPVADFYARHIQLETTNSCFQLNFFGQYVDIHLPLPGQHNISNAIGAAAVAAACGAEIQQIVEGLNTMKGVQQRLITHELNDGKTLIDDSYNANPASMRAAIDTLAQYTGKRLLVIGDMHELGNESALHHRNIGSYAQEKGIEGMAMCGRLSQLAGENFTGTTFTFASVVQALEKHMAIIADFDIILIKGSRAAHMDRLVHAICAERQ